MLERMLNNIYKKNILLHLQNFLFIFVFSILFLSSCYQSPAPLRAPQSSSSNLLSSNQSLDSCTVFSNNSYDYLLCQSCVQSTGSTDLTTLAQCVHANQSAGGTLSCLGLTCGSGQIADFATCSCKDSQPSSSFGSQPGYDPSSITPNLYFGLSIGSRTCFDNSGKKAIDCFWGWFGETQNIPKFSYNPPENVFVETDYLRWDLSLDNSVFPAFVNSDLPFTYSYATLIGNYTLNYQLKNNTSIQNTSNIKICDCTEHFSGFSDSLTSYYSTPSSCFKTSNWSCSSSTGGGLFSPEISQVSNNSGYFLAPNISLNGKTSFPSLLVQSYSYSGGTVTLNDYLRTDKGLGKKNLSTNNTALFSNIGTYKYSIGPIEVKSNITGQTIKTEVTKRLSINANLGFKPVDAVESSAFAPQTIINRKVTSRDCTDSSNPCVVSVVYRTQGGGVALQNFSPSYSNHASQVLILPSNIKVVSTPKIIEDRTQISTSDTTTPPKLRVFARASDGNIYMTTGYLGQFSDWVSLGRPWTAPNVSDTKIQTSPPVYWPITTNFLSNIGFPNALSTNMNDGISIVGEPQVAYYEDSSSPKKGLIIIMVRVSHFQNDGNLGAYHNSIFFTVGRSIGANNNEGFDSLYNWSRWLPILDGLGSPISIQGNPSVFIDYDNNDSHIKAFFFATKLSGTLMDFGPTNLHPPVGPYGSGAFWSSPYINKGQSDYFSDAGSDFINGTNNWFSYGHELIYGYVDLTNAHDIINSTTSSNIFNCSLTPTETCSNLPDYSSSSATAGAFDNNGTNNAGVIISDWQIVRYDDSPGKIIRVYANVLRTFRTRDDGGNHNCYQSGSDKQYIFAPTIYKGWNDQNNCGFDQNYTYLKFYEFRYNDQALGYNGQAQPLQIVNAVGNPNAVLLDVDTPQGGGTKTADIIDQVINSWSTSPASSAPPNTDQRILFTTRTINTKSNILKPFFQFGLNPITNPINNNDAVSVYRYNGVTIARSWWSTGKATIYEAPMFFPTSDIVPIKSNALKNVKNDVPVYLFTRDPNGKIAVGVWGSSNNGIDSKMFQFSTVGLYTD